MIRNLSLYLIALLILSCADRSSKTEVNLDPQIAKKMLSLLRDREYFDLRTLIDKHHDNISTIDQKIFSAFIQNGFNQNTESNTTINELIKEENKLADSVVVELMLVQRDNHIKLFDYKNAAATGDQIVDRFKNHFDEEKLHHIENKNKIYRGLHDTPAQRTVVTGDGTIKWKRDKVGLMRMSVSSGGTTDDFIFDTRAGISVIMRSYAEKLKLRMTGVRYEEGSGITGKTFEAELGIADSLTIENLKCYNVVFQVLPDEILSFPSIDYSMHGIIGFPVITQWKHLRINNNGVITILKQADEASPQNLAFDEAAIVLHTRADEDTLSFYLDSGANNSELFANYFAEKQSKVKQVAKVDSVEFGGVGGIQKKEVYTLPVLNFQIGDKVAALKELHIATKPPYTGQKYYGNLGQDLLSQFAEITFDFERMSMSLK